MDIYIIKNTTFFQFNFINRDTTFKSEIKHFHINSNYYYLTIK